jgi:polar amino acid transport system substrate-binding protein
MKGRVVVVGQVGMDLVRDPFYRKELDLRLSMSYGPGRYDPAYEEQGHDYPIGYVRWTEERNLAAFLELVRAGKVTPAALVSHRFPIASAEAAYDLLESGNPCLGVLLNYPADATLDRRVVLAPVPRTAARGETRVGMIGAGNFAKGVLIPVLKKLPNVTLGGVVTSGGISAHHAASKFGFSVAATDVATVIGDPETDAVVIATRHSSHARLARMALEAGKHVFCEKPLTLTRDELAEVIAAAQRSAGILTVGFNRRCAPHVRAIKEMIAARAGQLMMSYRINAGAVPATSWLVGEEGGGRVLGEVCHFVDTMSYLAGAPVTRVSARRLEASADSVAATLTFADGSIGTILYTSVGDPSLPKERLEVFASGRVAVLDDFRWLTLSVAGKRRRRRAMSRDKGHRALLAAFVAATRGEGTPPMSLAEIANVTSATFAIEEAVRTRAEMAVE